MKKSKPELLAPVGGWPQLKAAVNNGADAVYMGGSLFNARIKADNFTKEDMQAAVDYAHERNVKVYVTFNTLIKEEELEKAFEYACYLYEIGTDAVILQDMGLARLIHKYLPDFTMHLSTQGTVYNPQALELARDFGFARIVPARELTLEETCRLKTEAAKPEINIEIEVFVHGALCMCYSGQCQMSRLLGAGKDKEGSGRSGNRGLCAQPCRLPYTDDKGEPGYWLSPKDICTIDRIPELIDGEVDSFKIEGRLKSAEYVATVTRIYRKYIDLDASGKRFAVDDEDRQELTQIFNRGGFTEGYLEGNPGQKILSGSSPKNQGVYVGKVTAVAREIKGRSKTLIDLKIAEGCPELHMGDGVEIRSPREAGKGMADLLATGNVITYIEELPGRGVRIGDFDKGVRKGDSVYKVTDKELNTKALSAPEKKIPVIMKFSGRLGESPVLEMTEACGDKLSVKVTGDFAVEPAVNKPTDADRVSQQIAKLGDTPFLAEKVFVNIDEGAMIPVSVINGMRREAAEMLLEEKHVRRSVSDEVYCLAIEDVRETAGSGQPVDEKSEITGKKIVALREFIDSRNKSALPYILNVSKGSLDKYIEGNFHDIVAAVKETGILIGNMGWIRQFLDAGVTVYGDYGLNSYNSQCVKAYEDIGVRMAFASHETGQGDERFKACKQGNGKIPLMITEHPLKTDYITDRKGVRHEVVRMDDKYLIF